MSVRRTIWIPSLLVGIAVATALGTAAGVLLYDGEGLLREVRQVLSTESDSGSLPSLLLGDSQGLLRAFGVLLGVSAASLVAGLWVGTVTRDDETVTSAARGWMGLLVALLLGAGYTALWEAMDGFGGVPAAQGAGLALTAALPAYFAGGVWAGLGSFAESLGIRAKRQVGVGGVVGVVIGCVLVDAFLAQPLLAVTAFLGATVLASAGARCQGWIFDRVPRRCVVFRDPARPELRFEVWHTAVPAGAVRLLVESGRDLAVDPPPAGDWRRAVAGALRPDEPVLFIGAGSWFVPGEDREWSVYETDTAVAELAAKGFRWGDGTLARAPVPEAPGHTVVAEWGALGDSLAHTLPLGELLAALHDAEVFRVWIRRRRGGHPDMLVQAGRKAGFDVSRYLGTVSAVVGPPRLVPRGDELWCFSQSSESPGPLTGMKMAPVPGDVSEDGSDS